METKKIPYEFLVRWGRDGGLGGAHVQWRYVTVADDGTVLGEFIGDAEPVSVAASAGFPLRDILDEAHIAALTDREHALARLATRA